MPQQNPDAAAEAKAQSQNPIETLTGQDHGDGDPSKGAGQDRQAPELTRSLLGSDVDPAEGKR